MTKRIGLFGGTFNPLHFGHLSLVLELKERHNLTAVWFIPNQISPLRMDEPPLPAHHRLKMLELVLDEIEGFEVCDIEIQRPSPSFTIDTVKEILNKWPDDEFFLLLGEDTLLEFEKWHQHFELIRLIPFLVGSRPNTNLLNKISTLGLGEQVENAIKQGLTPTKQIEISASEVRERLKKRLYCGHLVPGKILDYIYENQLYFNLSPRV